MPVVVVTDDDNNNGHIKREPGVIDIDDARRCGLEWWWRKRNGQSIQTNKQMSQSRSRLVLSLKGRDRCKARVDEIRVLNLQMKNEMKNGFKNGEIMKNGLRGLFSENLIFQLFFELISHLIFHEKLNEKWIEK